MSGGSPLSTAALVVHVHRGAEAEAPRQQWTALRERFGAASPSLRPEWLAIMREGLGHTPYYLEARHGDETSGVLPMCFLNTRLFGKFLVGLPYLNVGGVLADDELIATALIDQAVRLADELDVRYLELRHEHRWPHPALGVESTQKVHMRLDLPSSEEELWRRFKPKVRNQIRKSEEHGLTVHWGADDLLNEFYHVFAVNMRDLGTPVFGRRLFAAIMKYLGSDAELCVIRRGDQPCAAGMLLHGSGITETPSASSLRRLNHLNANMLLYWSFLRRSIARGQRAFDFGRTSVDSNTYRFKAQWGATPHPAVWQYYVRHGSVGDLRPDNPTLQRRIAVWKRLPVWVTRLAGPPIVRGIP